MDNASLFTVRVLCLNCWTEHDMEFTRGTKLRAGYPGPQHLQDITRGEFWNAAVDVQCALCGVANLSTVRRTLTTQVEIQVPGSEVMEEIKNWCPE